MVNTTKIESTNPKKYGPLTEVESFLVENNFDPNNLWHLNKAGHTPVSAAISQGKTLKFLDLLINAGASINQPHQFYGKTTPRTPLQQAVIENNPELVLFLLKNNADFNQIIQFDGRFAKRLTDLIPNFTSKTSPNRKLWKDVAKQLKKLGAFDSTDPLYQPQAPIENLVFEGGGAKGAVYVGALEILEKNGTLSGIKRVAGSSAGGITSMLIALGFSAGQVKQEMEAMDFTRFMDGGGILQKTFGLLWSNGHGIYDGAVFHQWAKDKVAAILGNPDATFADLRRAIQENPATGLKELYITGTNLSTKRLEIFSADTTPNMKIADAVRATMSFPGAFKAFPLDKGDGVIQYYADGGIKNNYPMHIFDEKRFVAEGYTLDEVGGNPCTLGFKVDSATECSDILWNQPKADHSKGFGLMDWVKGLFGSLKNSDKEETYRKHSCRTVQIPDQGIGTLQFALTPEQKEALTQAGRISTDAYFENYRTGFYAVEGAHSCRPELDRRTSKEELVELRAKLASELMRQPAITTQYSEQMKRRELNKRLADLAKVTGEDLTKSMLGGRLIAPNIAG